MIALPMAGLISALLAIRYLFFMLLSGASLLVGHFFVSLVPALFGALVWLGLWEFWGMAPVRKGAIFVGASVVAVSISHVLGAMALFASGAYAFDARHEPNSIVFFPAGFAGAYLLFFAVLKLIFPAMSSRMAFKRALPWAAAGGVLGVLGWALGPSLGKFLWFTLNRWHLAHSQETFQHAQIDFEPQCYSLYFVWQTAVSFLIGVACWREAQRPGQSRLPPLRP